MEALCETINIYEEAARRMNDLPDNHLMMMVRNGDLDKLGVLFERYKSRLFRYFYLHTGDQPVSEDLVQNVFIRILRFRERFEPMGEFRSWMFTIAYHAKVDHFRSNKYASRCDAMGENDLITGETAEDEMIRRENVSRLEEALRRLRDDYREVLILSRYEGLKYGEIGEMIGCSQGAVKVRIHRAIHELREIFDGLE